MNDSSLIDPSSSAAKVISILNKNLFHDQANKLKNNIECIISTNNDEKRKSSIELVNNMCNIRWLGDLYIKNVSQTEWYDLLDKLSKYVSKKKWSAGRT